MTGGRLGKYLMEIWTLAGVDTKLAQIREVQALHTTRFSTLERKLDEILGRLASDR